MKIQAKKLPSGTYRVQVYVGEKDGKRIYKSFSDPDRDKAELMASKFATSCSLTITDMTLSQAMTAYIESRKNVLSPTTYETYQKYQRLHYKPLKDKPINEVKETDIQIYINTIAGTLSSKYVHNIHGFLSSVLGVYRPDLFLRTRLPEKKQTGKPSPSEAQIKALLLTVQDTPLEIPFLLAAFCGMRRGEIGALRYEDIDYSTNVIHIHKGEVYADRKISKKSPKNFTSDRYITVLPELLERIGKGQGRIITISINSISTRFERICEKLEITNVTFHDLRHYYVSKLHAAGIPDAYIQKTGGWKTDYVMKNVYRNVIDEAQKKFSLESAQAFENVLKNSEKSATSVVPC